MTLLVTGSRGRVGSALVGLLHDRGHRIRAASRAPESLDPPAGVATVTCDLGDPATFATALDGVDSVFLYAEPGHIGTFVEQAEAAGVTHAVLLSSSAVLAPDAADNRIAASHLEVERALEKASFATTFLRPGAFATNAAQWSWALSTGAAVDLPYPHAHTDPIHDTDLAEAALAVLTDPELRGPAYLLTGPESLTFTEQLAILARVTGRTVPVNTVTPTAWKESVASSMPAETADALLGYWAAREASPVPLTDTVERLTGHPARTFATWITDNAALFQD